MVSHVGRTSNAFKVTIETANIPLSNVSNIMYFCSVFRWSRGSVLSFGTQVRGFKPGRSRQDF